MIYHVTIKNVNVEEGMLGDLMDSLDGNGNGAIDCESVTELIEVIQAYHQDTQATELKIVRELEGSDETEIS
jgi:hypothetical protein